MVTRFSSFNFDETYLQCFGQMLWFSLGKSIWPKHRKIEVEWREPCTLQTRLRNICAIGNIFYVSSSDHGTTHWLRTMSHLPPLLQPRQLTMARKKTTRTAPSSSRLGLVDLVIAAHENTPDLRPVRRCSSPRCIPASVLLNRCSTRGTRMQGWRWGRVCVWVWGEWGLVESEKMEGECKDWD